jgi:hypothetical protein
MTIKRIKIKNGDRCIFSGPTYSGKTTAIGTIFNENFFDENVIIKIVYIFAKNFNQDPIEKIKNYCKERNISVIEHNTIIDFDFGTLIYKSCVVIDDMMLESDQEIKNLNQLFTVYAHHRGIIVFYSIQNFFYEKNRTIRLQANWIFMFESNIDQSSINAYFARFGKDMFKILEVAFDYVINDEKTKFLAINNNGNNIKLDSGFYGYFRAFEKETGRKIIS